MARWPGYGRAVWDGFEMKINVIAFLGAFGVLAWGPASIAGEGGPPISGSVQNFVAFDEPIAASLTPFSTNGDGERTLEVFRFKVVLVNFWATWCGPCVREMPTISRLEQKLGDEDFTVVIVSQDRDGWKRIEPFLKKRLKLEFENSFLDEGLNFSRAMQVRSLPVVAILDPQGNEVGRLVGGAEWDSPEAIALIQHYIDAGGLR